MIPRKIDMIDINKDIRQIDIKIDRKRDRQIAIYVDMQVKVNPRFPLQNKIKS